VTPSPVLETVGAALRRGADRLAAAGIDSPAREARLLAVHVLGLPSGALPDPAAPIDGQRFEALVARRARREPMALITGRQGFWTLDFAVSPATLIPRPDSETLIEAALAAFPQRGAVRSVLDLGTGTGCLLLAALAEFPQAWGLGIDVAPEAARLAAANARRLGLSRAVFAAGRWAASVAHRFDLVLANPPYIATGELESLMPEVACFEPRRALDGGADGLAAYRDLLPALPALLSAAGVAVLEIGAGQADAVTELARDAGFTAPCLRQDLGGHARAVVLQASNRQKSFGTAGDAR
jgi:release factor glutamine methyltransferase